MHELELVLALLVAVAVVATVAQPLRVPYPVLLVLAGLVLALVPGTPHVELEPEIAFLLFLPPLLYVAAFDTSIRDVRANGWPIVSLAVGLVLATTAAVAFVAHSVIPELDWPTAFALGAIVSPPDAVAATAILRRLGVPRRLDELSRHLDVAQRQRETRSSHLSERLVLDLREQDRGLFILTLMRA